MAFVSREPCNALASAASSTLVQPSLRDVQPSSDGAAATSFAPRSLKLSENSTLYASGLKRVLDVMLVLLTAPFWLPVVALFALLVATDGHTPFYRQERVGKGGRSFWIWKLRTMVIDADAKLEAHLAANPAARAEWDATQKLKCDPRITTVGRILRKTSLDELPQLFNVLSGDMSLVGPRPMMLCQRDLYDGASYYALRPGLTGLWQVSARNDSRFSDRVKFDNTYAATVSLSTDVSVLMRTVGVVVRGTGY